MSSSDDITSVVQQKKDDTASVNWREYVALRDHLSRQFGAQCDKIQSDLAATDSKLENVIQTTNSSAAALVNI